MYRRSSPSRNDPALGRGRRFLSGIELPGVRHVRWFGGDFPPPRVELLGKTDCCLCEDAKCILSRIRSEIPFDYLERDITEDPALFEQYKHEIPVVLINGHRLFKGRVEADRLRRWLRRPPRPMED